MRSVDYYDSLPYKMVVTHDAEEGGYIASFPDLPGCITCADTKEKTIANAKDAKRAWIEAALESNVEIHEPEV